MDDRSHYKALERMYLAAPINQLYLPTITVAKGEAEISIELQSSYHHAAGAVHGSVYFKMLDDAAFFAANSLEPDCFVLTSSFTTYLIRPVSKGVMRSVGSVVSQTKNQFIAESVAYDFRGKEIARGNGIFVKGKLPFREAMGYDDD
ncbi:MAG: PaaI family thioesterase [Sedimenticola sp.]|nr:PaaI family thioesterase [Sedimenticola sp.]